MALKTHRKWSKHQQSVPQEENCQHQFSSAKDEYSQRFVCEEKYNVFTMNERRNEK